MLAVPPASCMVYTATELAEALVRAVGDVQSASWLEPSHGKGVFIKAIAALGVPKGRIVAVDLDRTSCSADVLANTFRGVDFLQWASTTKLRFDRIVGNPPFVSIERLPNSLQKTAASIVDFHGRAIGGGANLWYAFILTAVRLLKQGGCLALVLPAAAEFAGYSAEMRRVVRESFKSLELYRCRRPLFEEVQEGALVAVARGYGLHPCMVRRRSFASRASLIQGLSKSGRVNGHKCPRAEGRSAGGAITFGSIAKVRLGGVTGDAAYFLMTEKRRRVAQLPHCALQRVVTKAKHLSSGMLTNEAWNVLIEPCLLKGD